MRHPFLLILLIANIFAATAQDQPARKKHFNLDEGIAISGYDPVLYFTQRKALKGNKQLATVYEGVTYYFVSATSRDEFKKNPSKFEPAYGGWCAYAMGAKGDKVSIDPKTFKIVGGRLYLFYNKLFNNTLDDWNKDESNLKAKADVHWQKTISKN